MQWHLSLLDPVQTETPGPIRRDEALAFMRTHLTDPNLGPDEIAAGLHISRRTLFRLFEGTGESAMARLRSLRLERAKLMLQTQPDKSIATIALDTGFSSPVQFYRAFGLTEGMPPGEYQGGRRPRRDTDGIRPGPAP